MIIVLLMPSLTLVTAMLHPNAVNLLVKILRTSSRIGLTVIAGYQKYCGFMVELGLESLLWHRHWLMNSRSLVNLRQVSFSVEPRARRATVII